jgi:hypothetical protein
MTEQPIIEIYCDCSSGDPAHDRFIVAAYRRDHITRTPTPALWQPLKWWKGKQLRGVEQRIIAKQPGRSAWLQFRLRCDECLFDEQRNAAPREFMGRMFFVFDRLWEHDVSPLEISARGLIGQIDGLMDTP